MGLEQHMRDPWEMQVGFDPKPPVSIHSYEHAPTKKCCWWNEAAFHPGLCE